MDSFDIELLCDWLKDEKILKISKCPLVVVIGNFFFGHNVPIGIDVW